MAKDKKTAAPKPDPAPKARPASLPVGVYEAVGRDGRPLTKPIRAANRKAACRAFGRQDVPYRVRAVR